MVSSPDQRLAGAIGSLQALVRDLQAEIEQVTTERDLARKERDAAREANRELVDAIGRAKVAAPAAAPSSGTARRESAPPPTVPATPLAPGPPVLRSKTVLAPVRAAPTYRPRTCEVCLEEYQPSTPRGAVCGRCRRLDPLAPVPKLRILYRKWKEDQEMDAAPPLATETMQPPPSTPAPATRTIGGQEYETVWSGGEGLCSGGGSSLTPANTRGH